MGWGDMDWIHLAKDREAWRALENAVSKEEIAKLVQGFEKQDILTSSGVTLAGNRYIYLSGTDRVIRAKLGKVGVHCMKTQQEAVQHDSVMKVFKRLAGNLHRLTEQCKVGKAFNEGRQNVADMFLLGRPGRPSVSEEEAYALSALLESDRPQTIRELARETGLAHMTVLHILKDSARPHAAQAVDDLFDRCRWEMLYRPPYSPDSPIVPCDYDLIPKMKEPLCGIRFRNIPENLQAIDRSIRTITTTGAAKGFLRLPHRWQRVVHNAGDYIEGQ
ncbi:Profilin [Cryptotermes secundus]|uniref:Profilin n=1 Tax=Cryptotermes secundus TaxID=105785 RepID=A0A2J7PVG9_9NEOP|nr:Profilin [Cryptotermes secundus]